MRLPDKYINKMKEAVKEKIRELKLDRTAINEWIENTLNGD